MTPGLEDYLVDGEGLMAITLHTENVGSAFDWLVRGGFDPSDISETEIMVEIGNGPLPQKFRWLRLAPKTTPGLYFILVQQMTGHGTLIFVTEDNFSRLHPNVASTRRKPPFMGAMTLEVEDAHATAAILQANGVPHLFLAEGIVRVPAKHACGVVLQFHGPT